jgi:hypothetical protein
MSIRRRNIKEDHRDTFTIQYYGATAITDRVIGVVPVDAELIKVQEVHTTASADASAVTLMLEKLRHTETVGNGNDLLSAEINLKGTAATVQTGALITVAQKKTSQPFVTKFKAGDRIGLDVTGTEGTLADKFIGISKSINIIKYIPIDITERQRVSEFVCIGLSECLDIP